MDMRKIARLIAAVVLCQLAGIIGAIFTTQAIGTWYAELARPEFAPPNWIFAPVWTVLFLLMGIALFIVWEKYKAGAEAKPALSIFGAQLALNVLWSVLFFGLQSPALAFAEIILLWLAIAATIALFYKISKPAAGLMVPYILWVSFAAFLNYSFWALN
ncbi:MAG: TspO/MBR family protein [Candidatus Diapherotrites archaeon]